MPKPPSLPTTPPGALRALVAFLTQHFSPAEAPAMPELLQRVLRAQGASAEVVSRAWACVVDVLDKYRQEPEGAVPPLDAHRAAVLARAKPEALPPDEAERLRWFAAAPMSEVPLLVSRAMAVAALREVVPHLPSERAPTIAELHALVASTSGLTGFGVTLVEGEVALALNALRPSETTLTVAPWLERATAAEVREVLSRAALLP